MRLVLPLLLAVAPALLAQSIPDTSALFPARLEGDRWGYIDRRGAVAIPAEFEEAYRFGGDRARVLWGGRTHYIDRTGVRIDAPRLERGGDFAGGVAVVTTDDDGRNVRRFLAPDGTFPHGDTRYSQALEYRESLAPVRRLDDIIVPYLGPLCQIGFIRRSVCTKTIERPWVYVDMAGAPIIETPVTDSLSLEDVVFEHATVFAEGLAAVAVKEAIFLNPRWGFIDTTGTFVIEPQYQAAFPFTEERARIVQGGRFGFIRRDGSELLAPTYLSAGAFSEGRARVRSEAGWGYLNLSGILTIPATFEQATDFSEGCAVVRQAGRWRYIDRDGAAAFAGRFDYAQPFRDGLAYVRDGEREGYIDRNGAFVWERE